MRRNKTKLGRSTWLLAKTFSSHPMGRDENVLNCFLRTQANDDFNAYQKD